MSDHSTQAELSWIVWHAVMAAWVGLTALVAGGAPGIAQHTRVELAVLAVFTYLTLALLVRRRTRTAGSVSLMTVMSMAVRCLGGLLVVTALVRPTYPLRGILAVAVMLIGGGLLAVFLTRQPGPRMLATVGAALALLASFRVPGDAGPETGVIRSASHDLIATYIRAPFASLQVTGGALSTFGDDYLLATGDGALLGLRWDADTGRMDAWELPHRVPINRDEFVAQHPQDVVKNGRFRVGDILVEEGDTGFRLFASHHYWHAAERCFTVRVSEASGAYLDFLQATDPVHWSLLYETQPCLPYLGEGVFGGLQLGGKMEPFGEGRLLIAIGDQRRDGVVLPEIVSQDAGNPYGKTVVLDPGNDSSFTYSSGHRNPQGLHVDADGTVWATEHGPQGGDELNLVRPGGNYGWPLVTYGTNYDRRVWPLSHEQGRHSGFDQPIYAWVPSIGVTSVLRVEGQALRQWRGDLLLGSLRNKAVWRVRLAGERVVSMEEIDVGERIRDMIEDREGRLVLWTEGGFTPPTDGAVVVLETAEAVLRSRELADPMMRGEIIFTTRCAGCHLDGAAVASLGPSLSRVVGRPIALAALGYDFSPALKALSGDWTEERLDQFLQDPAAFAPGTLMEAEGIADHGERTDLITFLRGFR